MPLLFTFRLLITEPTCPWSCLCKYLLIHSLLSYCMQLTHLPGHCLICLILYITCSYFTCSSLVCISNKILPLAPSLASETSRPDSCKGHKTMSKASPICRSVIAHAITITPLIVTQLTCPTLTSTTHRLYSPHPACSPINFALPHFWSGEPVLTHSSNHDFPSSSDIFYRKP